MAFPTFDALSNQLIQLFRDQQYTEALDLVTREGPRFPADRLLADYWRMCAAARVDNRALVYQVAEQVLAEGLWYGEVMWRQSPSFQTLQGDPDFERIVATARAAEERDNPSRMPVLITRLPENHSSTSPLLVALHGNQRTAAHTLPFWQAVVSQGWGLALPQSTQAMFTGAYIWDDLAEAQASVQAHFAQLQRQIAFDPDRVVLAGHSMGGLVAIQMALTGALKARGFVANGPAVPFLDAPEALDALLDPARERGVRGYFIVGTNDGAINVNEIHALAEKLRSAEIACEVDTVPDATHDYSPAYDAALLRGLAFVDAA
jgi:dienelactone hydrolase